MAPKTKHRLDTLLEKIISRKMLAWFTATGLLAFADLASHDWMLITMVYIGSQAAVDIVDRLQRARPDDVMEEP